jgi:autotransporter-associated beta strand protein
MASTDFVTDINQAGPLSNVRLGAGVHTLTNARTINSLYLEDGAILVGENFVLTVESGAMVMGDGSQVNVSTLNLGARTYISVNAGDTATINSTIVGAATAISKSGQGKLTLTGDNQFAGSMFVNEGLLNIQRSNALGATAGATAVRQGATLEIEETSFGAINVLVEGLTLEGTGFNDLGAIRNIAGNNSWAGTITQAGPNTNLLAVLDGFPVINSGTTFYSVDAGSSLNLSGAITGDVELIKIGEGTLETSGAFANTFNAAARVLEGTLLLNKEPGVNALINFAHVGSDKVGAKAATLKLGGSDQIRDNMTVRVHSSGLFDLNNQADVINDLQLVAGPAGAADVTLGATGKLIFGNQATDNQAAVIVLTVGSGNPTGATITGGTIELNSFGAPFQSAARANRLFQINDGVAGTDLTITSVIADGSGLINMQLDKRGFGSLELGGTSANTFTGVTAVVEGTLLLNKTAGVNAIGGALTIEIGRAHV